MRFYRHYSVVVLATGMLLSMLLIAPSAIGQAVMQGESEAPTIDGKIQLEIIDSVTAALNEVYIFPEVAKKIEEHLRKQHKDGVYKDLTDTDQFTQKLTDDMEEISHDGHLWTRFVPDEMIPRFQQDSLSDDEIEKLEQERLREREYWNFNFVKAERMTGNVGYLRFDGFEDTYHAGATAIAALNFLAYCDALIIDLRNNGGGSPSMIQLITSYFFEETQHLNSFYIRKEDTTQQFWTQEFVQGPRMADVELYVLTSSYTFSAAEEFTYNLKNMERATIVGETTGGGAHPVNRRAFANLNVAISLPYGRAINPITGTNWEGTGVEPHVQVSRDDALKIAHIEAMKKLSEKTEDELVKTRLLWDIETQKTLMNPVTVDAEILKSYAGVYGPRVITFENGALYYQREGRPKYLMVAMSNDLFCFEDIVYFRIKINVNENGEAVELVGMYDNGRTDISPKGASQ